MKYVRNESETHMNEVDGRERERERERKKRHIKVWRLSLHTYTTPFGRCLHKPKRTG